jgi:lipoprotein-releasing system permease protein
MLARVRKVPHVVAAAPGLFEQVFVARGARGGGAVVEGILPDQEQTVSRLLASASPAAVQALEPQTVEPQDGSVAVPSKETPPLILGKDLADTVGASVGDTVTLISPQGEMTPMGVVPQYVRFRLAGTYHTGFYEYDSQMGFIRMADAQHLFDEPDLVSVISIRVDDPNRAPEIARDVEQAAGQGYMTTNWTEENRELFRALRLEQLYTFIVIALIVMVAALNILIALTMMVMEKTRDIAVLMSFGVQPAQIRRIFLLQGLLISVIGTAIGLVLGYAASWAGGHYHFIHLSAEVYSIDTLPFAPRVMDGVIVSVVSIGISLLATLYPSSAAASVLPAQALRYE